MSCWWSFINIYLCQGGKYSGYMSVFLLHICMRRLKKTNYDSMKPLGNPWHRIPTTQSFSDVRRRSTNGIRKKHQRSSFPGRATHHIQQFHRQGAQHVTNKAFLMVCCCCQTLKHVLAQKARVVLTNEHCVTHYSLTILDLLHPADWLV